MFVYGLLAVLQLLWLIVLVILYLFQAVILLNQDAQLTARQMANQMIRFCVISGRLGLLDTLGPVTLSAAQMAPAHSPASL